MAMIGGFFLLVIVLFGTVMIMNEPIKEYSKLVKKSYEDIH